jgi:hypothetical protein
MTRKDAVKVLDNMAQNSALSKEIVAVVKANYGEVDAARRKAQASASTDYECIT